MNDSPSLPSIPSPNPLLIVLSGPSGVGKDALLKRMKELGKPFHYTVTATTRLPRANEEDGVDYIFVSDEQFKRMVEQGELLEWALVYGNSYGVPKAQVRRALSKGKDVIIKTDVQGAATIKSLAPEAIFIFLMPPSIEELERRLKERKTESGGPLGLRLRAAQEEMKQLPIFDYIVVNHNDLLDKAVATIESIVTAEKCRVPPKSVSL